MSFAAFALPETGLFASLHLTRVVNICMCCYFLASMADSFVSRKRWQTLEASFGALDRNALPINRVQIATGSLFSMKYFLSIVILNLVELACGIFLIIQVILQFTWLVVIACAFIVLEALLTLYLERCFLKFWLDDPSKVLESYLYFWHNKFNELNVSADKNATPFPLLFVDR